MNACLEWCNALFTEECKGRCHLFRLRNKYFLTTHIIITDLGSLLLFSRHSSHIKLNIFIYEILQYIRFYLFFIYAIKQFKQLMVMRRNFFYEI